MTPEEGGADSELATRRAKLARLRASGVDPFGARFPRDALADELVRDFERRQGSRVRIAGRVMGLRVHGRAAFADLQDRSGAIQVYARVDRLGEGPFAAFTDLDRGDHVGVTGTLMRTRRGEVSVEAESWTMLAKGLRPLPEKWHGLRDVELRYRRRYLDLIVNPEVREAFAVRSRMITAMRRFLDERGFLEVETPVLGPIAAGAAARPFRTHHNALDLDLQLRIATELYLKRLIVGGLERVYEIGRVFRNEGVSWRHNPEYTMLEVYQAYADYEDMMALTEAMVADAAQAAIGTTRVRFRGQEIDLRPPWRRLSMLQALREATGEDVLGLPDDEAARGLARGCGVEVEPGATRGQVMDALVDRLVLPRLVQPTFLMDHPVEISPLARARRDDPRVAARFEPVVGGFEIGNAYSELNDPDEQRARFRQQVAERARGNEEAHPYDEDFVRALEYGMPPTGGLGVGIDRVAMLLTGADSIRDVILFPLLRPESSLD
jgi:lysyl-tRNA synthetase class 2